MAIQQRKRLHTWHRELMRRVAVGEEPSKVAKELGFSVANAQQLVKSPLFQQELAKMQARLDESLYDAFSEIRNLQPEAVLALKQLVKNKRRPDLRLAAAREILNRSGINAAQQVEISETAHLSYEQRLEIASDPPQPRLEYLNSEIKVLSGAELEATDAEFSEEPEATAQEG